MKAHLVTTLIGALFIGSIACLRGAAREMAAPLASLETMARPERLAPVQIFEEEAQTDTDVIQIEHASDGPAPLHKNPRRPRECGGTTGTLLNFFTQCLKVNEAQRSRILSWILWKEELLFDVEHDENQKKHVEETFEGLVIAELDHAQAELYRGFFNLNRPPVGGYDIGAVGFTDQDKITEDYEDADYLSSAKLLDILVNPSSETPVVYGVNISTSVHGVNK